MKKIVLFTCFYLSAIAGFSQIFQQNHSLTFKASIISGTMADARVAGIKEYFFIKNDSLFSFDLIGGDIMNEGIIFSSASSLHFADISRNNFLDLVFTDSRGIGYLKNSEGTFSGTPVFYNIKNLEKPQIKDLDLNGSFDLIGINDHKLILFPSLTDSILLTNSRIKNFFLLDYDNQNGQDVLLIEEDGLSRIMIHENKLKFSEGDTLGYFEYVEAFDFNGTGINDLLILDQQGKIFLNQDSATFSLDSLGFTDIQAMKMVDLNSDGQPDIVLGGKRNNKNTVSFLLSNSLSFTLEEIDLENYSLTEITLGDVEHDGDLDLILVTEDNGFTNISFYKNETQEINLAPSMASNATAFPTLNGVYLFFDSAWDDHTPAASLSYDLLCYQSDTQIIISSDFRENNKMRLINRLGNIGRNLKAYLPDVAPGFYTYFIQGIDNSLFSSSDICTGNFQVCDICTGGFQVCDKFEIKDLTICKGDTLFLEADQNTEGRWFSANKRDLIGTEIPSLQYVANVSDTIYYASTLAERCEDYRIWRITVKDPLPEKIANDTIACLGNDILFNIDQVDSLTYRSLVNNNFGNENPFSFTVTEPLDTIVFKFHKEGCIYTDTISVKGQNPEVVVSREHISILPGGTATLEASGAEIYEWSPSSGLSDPNSAITSASPAVSTTYQVVGFDSLNCQDSASVIVEVNQVSYIPNLFTPNNDGTNDRLRVIGLKDINLFEFIIYDRNGKIIYRTQDPSEASTKGWDGSLNGSLQPDGVYYWSISGTYNSGKEITLNGKIKGEIILKR